ncbi:hypothetical protein CC851_25175 [Salmonella enterica subsp. enterica serovar Kasenyi]|nr:hypothetical protein [Salmonella enterica subsp. enterica serovar Kasenyi]
MKKTLIALAVAASAVVSGSAMAWTANGTGGNVELGGTLSPQTKVTPWEVQTGAAVTNLDGQIQKGLRTASVDVKKGVFVLGIRTQKASAILGSEYAGNIPQISYGGKLNLDSFNNGVGTVTLDALNKANSQKIGSVKVPLLVGGVTSWSGKNGNHQKFLVANAAGQVFFGGLPKSAKGARDHVEVDLAKVSSEFSAHYVSQGGSWDPMGTMDYSGADYRYNGYYGSVIEAGAKIQINLDAPAAADAIAWKASLPVTVSYQ